jgi:chemotaxis protein MotB
MKYLIERGVDAARLNAIGYGPDNPIDTNDTKEGRARNRRVEFVVLGLPEDAKTPEGESQPADDENAAEAGYDFSN